MSLAFSNKDTGYQTGDARVDVHDGATREVKYAPIPEEGSVSRPSHVADGEVGKGEPQDREDEYGGKLHPFRKGAHDEGGCDDREGHLEGNPHRFGNGAAYAACIDVRE